MTRGPSVEQVAEDLLESILAAPKRQRRLLSKTFWHRFGFKVRSRERVDQVWAALRDRGVIISVTDGEFGSEGKKDWVVLSYVEPHPTDGRRRDEGPEDVIPQPDPEWFEQLAQRRFASEREVEYFFAIPLLEQLGYAPGNCAVGHRVEMYEGVKKVSKEADLVVFADEQREDALIVVEAKRMGRPLTDDVAGQAKAYSLWLRTPYYVLTNGNDIRVYHFRGPWHADVLLLSFTRAELREKWAELYRCLNPETVVEFKQRLREQLQSLLAV
jgi:hypothetical protein